jgi:integrase
MKRRYFTYLKEAKRYSEASIDAVAKAIDRFETDTKHRDFKAFHIEQAIAFKRRLSEQVSHQTGERLSKSTLYSTLTALRNFFQWLAGEPGFRSRLSYSDADYFNLSEKETRVAKARREVRAPTVEQVRHVLRSMPIATPIDRRNRALVALTLLTGARDRAIASLKVKHINLERECIVQDAREVQTKFSKTFTTWFFPVGREFHEIIEAWVHFLNTYQLWSAEDPWFPATKVALGEGQQFEATGLDRKHWKSAGPIRKIFREAFEAAGLPYANPHSFRNTLVELGQRLCRTPEEFKAWSQNLGHEEVMTTFMSYGTVEPRRQEELIKKLSGTDKAKGGEIAFMEKIRSLLEQQENR